MQKTINFLACFLVILLCVSACYQQVDGCLDNKAKNFEVSADLDCCCVYPSIKVPVSYRLFKDSNTIFNLNVFYLTDNGDSLSFLSSGLVFSNFVLENTTTGITLSTVDSNLLYVETNSGVLDQEYVKQDIAFFDKTVFVRDIGGYKYNEVEYDKVSFKVGLTEKQKQISVDSLNEGTTLYGYKNQLFNSAENNWNDYSFSFKLGSKKETISVDGNIDLVLNYSLSTPKLVTLGDDISIVMRINFLDLFKGVDVADLTPTSITNLLITNIKSAIEIE